MFEELWPDASDKPYDESLGELSDALSNCDSVIIGAGSGLSTAAGYLYAGEIMDRYFREILIDADIRQVVRDLQKNRMRF